MKTKECPECNYPMTKKLIRKGGVHTKRIENWECQLCPHTERIGGANEYARACKIKND